MNWLQGVFQYIEKIWQGVYCFFFNFYNQIIDILRGFYSEFVLFFISVLSILPAPDVLMNFQWPTVPQYLVWAIHDLGLRDALALVAGGATIRITREFLKMVAK